ncbi:hypothetical protein [Salinisphaera sp. G21_0]|uniref:hypothetical protein n=1 Tax=Salinisphaera sp. G21_0 TaxID=2821094 RepID=UPI001ADC6312|nr:hypothetical protein [Salinisphaera sp. G21_0]MBO9482295.1 hypothetical protein [Salinisphaera sp. G21_0]
MSNRGSAFTARVQKHGSVFGLKVGRTAPSNYVNSFIPCRESFHNPLSDSRFKKIPVRVIYSQEYEQSASLDLSYRPGAYQGVDRNTRTPGSPPELRSDWVWSMAGESSDPLPAGNKLDLTASAAKSGESLTIIIDNAHEQDEKRKAARKAYQKLYRKSEKGKAIRRAYQNAYYKAYYKAFRDTHDLEQARFAGRQAAIPIRESYKAKK